MSTKITASAITAGMIVQSRYLGNGRDFYPVTSVTRDRGSVMLDLDGAQHEGKPGNWALAPNSKVTIR